jgi:hypothetical protein
MKKSTKLIIAFLFTLTIVGLGIGLYFMLAKKKSGSNYKSGGMMLGGIRTDSIDPDQLINVYAYNINNNLTLYTIKRKYLYTVPYTCSNIWSNCETAYNDKGENIGNIPLPIIQMINE